MIINKDLTRESVKMFVTNNQIYAKIWHKCHGKWVVEEYFQSYNWEPDKELVSSTIKYIMWTWNLKNPIVRIE